MKRQICVIVLFPFISQAVIAETPPAQESAVKELIGFASNLQKNRDGTVRFIRFSKPHVTNEHVLQIAAFEQLDYLAVVTPTVNDEGLVAIAGLTNLDTLFLSDSGATDATLPHFKNLKKLERLYLDRLPITDAGLVNLSGLHSLKVLSLRETKISDAGLASLASLKNLEVLQLQGCRVGNAGLSNLESLSKMQTLRLDGTEVTSAGMDSLIKLSELQTLSLRNTHVTSAGLARLKSLNKLSQVFLAGTNLSSPDRDKLEAELPSVSFQFDPIPEHSKNAWERFLSGEALRGPEQLTVSTPKSRESEVLAAANERFSNAEETPDFQKHVLPLLGRLGCNGRTCHGSFQGQGGFSLSMFGYDFEADRNAIGDRLDLDVPEDSWFLLKPTMQEKHGGGLRFEKGSWEHQLLHRWIADGAPGTDTPQELIRYEVIPSEISFERKGQSVPLKAVAVWADGRRENVTPLCRFQTNDDAVAEVSRDGLVTSRAPGDTHIIAFYDSGVTSIQTILPISDRTGENYPEVPTPTPIDELVVQKLSRLGIVPSELSPDTEFLRRVSLDLCGTLPTPGEIEAFVSDTSPKKRSQKIDELLESSAYAEWWTVKLSDLTGSNSQYLGTTDMNTPAAQQWNGWIKDRVQRNVGWDEIAAGIILSESRRPGQTYEEYADEQSRMLSSKHPEDFTDPDNPMHYYWFRSNNQTPEERALSFGYVFLGVRLQCAQCHKHPFDQWSKQDFEKFTQFFTRIKAGIAPDAIDAQTQLKTKLGVPVKLDTAALRRQMYLRVSAEGLPIPWNEIWIEKPGKSTQLAKLLGDAEFDLNDYADPREPLVAWLLRENNRYFAPAFVNRVWEHYFGVGIVDPPDDFNLANPPSNKPLLDWLSREFIAHDYDMKWLHRTIANSRTYQLGFRPNETNRTDERNFSRSRIRRLPAEVTIDAILQATASDALNQNWCAQTNNRKIGQHPKSIQTRGIDYSLLVFGKPLRTTNCDCERQMQPTLLQSLYVKNDHEMIGWLERPESWLIQSAGRLGESLTSDVTPQQPLKIAPKKTDEEPPTVDELIRSAYLRTLSREPTPREQIRAYEHLQSTETRIEGLRDLLWALLNTQEFLTNH